MTNVGRFFDFVTPYGSLKLNNKNQRTAQHWSFEFEPPSGSG
jgi:hypothetical protein